MARSFTRMFANSEIKVYRLFFAIFFLLFISNHLSATHNRAGEITYIQIDDLTIEITITTYTKTSSTAADRDSVEVFWGDGTSEHIIRANGQGEPIEPRSKDIKYNIYVARHSYPSRGTYTIGMLDPNRVSGILNIDFPNSVNIPFYIETTFTLLNTQFQGQNNSAILLQPPIDQACVGKPFVHTPNGYDPDGDSLSYELAVPFQDVNTPVPNYIFPDQIIPGPENKITINPITGEIIWDSPQSQGEVNLTIKINEYRQGILINTIIRDMQVTVTSCKDEDNPPTLDVPDEICVIAGELVEFDVIADDPDSNSLITLSATGGPLILGNGSATFEDQNNQVPPQIVRTFRWKTNCNHVSNQYYQVVFKTVDNSLARLGANEGLAELKTVRIKVVAPPPLEVNAESINGNIEITWQYPYRCQETKNNYFQGFSVWRRLNSSTFSIDSCETGLPNQGFEKIIPRINEVRDNSFIAIDVNAQVDKIYCYRVLAEFAQTSASGFPFNLVESLASNETCSELLANTPLITKASVLSTSSINGENRIEWILPDSNDVIGQSGPYNLTLLRGDKNGNNFVPIQSIDFDYFNQDIDLFYNDFNLNTLDDYYTYKLDFYTSTQPEVFTSSPTATTPYLEVAFSDQRANLSWKANVPWSNYQYLIYRKIENSDFELIDSTFSRNYIDENLENDINYCYKVETFGSYGISRADFTIMNYSQEWCGQPLDTVPPCEATISISNFCNNPTANSNSFVNTILWQPISNCPDPNQISSYNLYYSSDANEPLELLANLDNTSLSYEHIPNNGISGCYAITSLDKLNNESDFSEKICLDNCPAYELPNTFTPNNDGSNDLFLPRINRFNAAVEFKVFNKWGNKVFETGDPELNWDGTTTGGKALAQGTYYYTLKIFEQRLNGVSELPVLYSGHINLIR